MSLSLTRRRTRPRPLGLTLGLLASVALLLGTATSAHAASRTADDSDEDVLVDDPGADYDYFVYQRTDIDTATLAATKSTTTLSWDLDSSADDLADGSYTRVGKLRVEALVKKTRTGVKTSKTSYVVTYEAGSLDPLTLEKVTADGPVAVACDELYYEPDGYEFSIEVDNACLGTKLYRVGAVVETHAVDAATSTEMADTIQVKPVLY